MCSSDLINTLCDLTPTLQHLSLPGTDTEIGLRAAKSLAIRGLALRDSIELVTWLHDLPVTGAKEFLNLMRDSPRATVLHVLEGCEQIALLTLVTQGYLPSQTTKHTARLPRHSNRDLFAAIAFAHSVIPGRIVSLFFVLLVCNRSTIALPDFSRCHFDELSPCQCH